MKRILCAAVAVVIEVPDDDSPVGVPLAGGPLGELAERLRQEACHGRDCRRPECTLHDWWQKPTRNARHV